MDTIKKRSGERLPFWLTCLFPFILLGGLCEYVCRWRSNWTWTGPGRNQVPHQPWTHCLSPLYWSFGIQWMPHYNRYIVTQIIFSLQVLLCRALIARLLDFYFVLSCFCFILSSICRVCIFHFRTCCFLTCGFTIFAYWSNETYILFCIGRNVASGIKELSIEKKCF